MPTSTATLHLMCGKIASGKSTLTAKLGGGSNTIVLAEDEWLVRLFPDQIKAIPDYVSCAERLRTALQPHIVALLRMGVSVVLDFPANTMATRYWMRTLIEESGANHTLHYLDVPDAVCKARLQARNAAGKHFFFASDAEFDLITSYFVAPHDSEGFNVLRHTPD
jgi:predicted kinase